MLLLACKYTPPGESSPDGTPAPADTQPPITCGELQCSGNATCDPSGPSCACKDGFAGDGITCDDLDECATNNGSCASICLNTSGSFTCATPTSCADVKTLVPTAVDGTFTLAIEGDPNKLWQAHCADLAGTPTEYLTVSGTGMYNAGGSSPGTDVVTTYTKVRIRLAPLAISIADRRFATSTGMIDHSNSGTMVTSMPVAIAMDCVGNNSNTGAATLDLRGTPFSMAAGSFAEGGSQPDHTISLTDSNRLLAITGGGFCGWYGASDATSNPFNDNLPNAALPISYTP